MDQPDFFDIPSPCVGVCRVNNRGFCVGCWRSRDERLMWLKLSDGEKHHVMRLIASRKTRIEAARAERRQPADLSDEAAPEPTQADLFGG